MVFPTLADSEDYTPDTSADKVAIKDVVEKFVGNGSNYAAIMNCWAKIKNGVKKFYVYRYELSVTTTEKTMSLDKDLGKISKPSGAPELPWTDGNWLMTGCSCSGTTADGFTITKEYKSSAEGAAWDKDLYS